jgi:predicted regulator of Ras-like GTPase activity (Roadblock/LC7/MglB family)
VIDSEEGAALSTPVHPTQDLDWLVTNFVERVPHVAHALIMSSDGLPMAVSDGFPPDRADQLAVVTSGLSSLAQGASRVFDGGMVVQTIVELEGGLLIVMTISHAANLAVLAEPDAALGIIAYEMTLLVERAGRMITPPARHVSDVAVVGSDRRQVSALPPPRGGSRAAR